MYNLINSFTFAGSTTTTTRQSLQEINIPNVNIGNFDVTNTPSTSRQTPLLDTKKSTGVKPYD